VDGSGSPEPAFAEELLVSAVGPRRRDIHKPYHEWEGAAEQGWKQPRVRTPRSLPGASGPPGIARLNLPPRSVSSAGDGAAPALTALPSVETQPLFLT